MKNIVAIAIIFVLSSCGADTFINHKLKAEKTGACTNEITPVKITSNINGEHFEFEQCLAEGFDGKNYNAERKGDSIIVTFPGVANTPTALYKITLDIDAYPPYKHISLGGRTIAMKQAERL